MKIIIVIASALLGCAGALSAQTFIQMSDPQFGMYSKNQNFVHETANFEFAIATANRLKPAFVVVTGDLINQGGNAAQTAEYHRIAAKLAPGIRLFPVAGNHDIEYAPTKETLASYREHFGPDYYTFRIGEIAGFVLNSSLEVDPHSVPEEGARMEAWLKSELAKARNSGARHIIVFQHIPFFLEKADEEDKYFDIRENPQAKLRINIPRENRARYLKLLHDYGVEAVFAGHYHRNAEGHDGALDMVTTGAVGMPLEGAKSGMRIVAVSAAGIKHQFYELGELPESLEAAK